MFTAFFMPLVYPVLITGFFIVVDTLVGRWAAKHYALKNNIEPRLYVTSKKTRIGMWEKIITYNIILISIFLLDDLIFNEFVTQHLPFQFLATKVAVLMIFTWEYDSIDEKYYNVKGIRLSERFKQFADRLKSFIRSLMEILNIIKR